MSVESFQEFPIEVFGGLCTCMDPADLPPGLSPNCQDVEFYPGGVRTRPGTRTAYFRVLGADGDGFAFGLKSFVNLALTQKLLCLDSDGRFQVAVPDQPLTVVQANLRAGCRMKSITAYGAEFIALSDGKVGADKPLQWDDANLDRVSQYGPGGGVTAAENAAAGTITVGTHKVVCWFITRSGYWTKFSPPVSWNASGAKKVNIGIPIGPANVLARGIGITLANGAKFYHLADRMLIGDNTTTSVTLDFDDATLGSGLEVTYLQNLEVLNYCASVVNYADRNFYLGEENGIPGLNNLGFEGGQDANNNPLGWTPQNAVGNGGAPVQLPDEWGCAYRITLPGAGKIWQTLYHDQWTQTPILEVGKSYNARVKLRRSAGANAGQVKIVVGAATIPEGGIVVNISDLATTWTEYEDIVLGPWPAIPADIQLRIYVDGAPGPAAEYVEIDELRIVPAIQQRIGSRLRASKVGDPETIDGTNGFLMVKENDGQELRAAFELRNFLYMVKERGLHVTSDNGTDEPAKWDIETVDPTVGTPSVHGVDACKHFAIIANKNGAYYFDGGMTQNISREIQNQDTTKSLWDRIYWDGAGEKIWVKIDEKRKRVLLGVPLDGHVECSHILCLDYSDLPGPAGALLTDPVDNGGRGRKWTLWTTSTPTAAAIVETSGLSRLFLGAGSSISEMVSGLRNDEDRGTIGAIYDTAYLGGSGFGRRLFGYMVLAITGSGTLTMKALRPGANLANLVGGTFKALKSIALKSPNTKDTEAGMNISDNRLAFRFQAGTGAEQNTWFDVCKAKFYTKQDPWSGGQ